MMQWNHLKHSHMIWSMIEMLLRKKFIMILLIKLLKVFLKGTMVQSSLTGKQELEKPLQWRATVSQKTFVVLYPEPLNMFSDILKGCRTNSFLFELHLLNYITRN